MFTTIVLKYGTTFEFVRHLDCCNPFCDRYSPARVPREQAGENDPASRARYHLHCHSHHNICDDRRACEVVRVRWLGSDPFGFDLRGNPRDLCRMAWHYQL